MLMNRGIIILLITALFALSGCVAPPPRERVVYHESVDDQNYGGRNCHLCGTVRDIEKALNESRIGITPSVDGKIIRLPIPELSEERRKDLVRSLGKMAEEARVRVRGNRRTALDEAKKLKASGGLTEDGLRDTEGEVQKLTDRFVKSIDEHLSRKEAEIMKV